MKIIALPDLHGNTRNIDAIGSQLEAADVVLLPGDITNGRMDELDRVLDALRPFVPFEKLWAIPGNMDTERIVSAMNEQKIGLHPKNKVIDDVTFIGMGGSLPFVGTYIYHEEDLAKYLTVATDGANLDLPTVLMCHQPPLNTINDVLRSGEHVGSRSVRVYIEEHQPLVCFTGHIHEGMGIDEIGSTKIINPGRLWINNSYAYAEIEDGELKTLEVREVSV